MSADKTKPRWLFQREKFKALARKERGIRQVTERARADRIEAAAQAVVRARELRGWLYFIQCATGPVKIGHGATIESRISNLQMGNPNRLTLLAAAVVDDAPGVEELLHERFVAHHVRGEWFKPVPELLQFAKKFNTHIEASINWIAL